MARFSTEGYDAATRLYLMAPLQLKLIPEPTPEDAIRALALIDGLLGGFPFVDGESKSVGRSALLTTVCRGAFPVAPMHTARGPTAGTGKSYLWDVVAVNSTGQLCPVMTAGPSTEEMEKRLGSALLAGQALISIDNVSKELGGDALCQAIERPMVQIRILGRSELFTIEARGTTILATGNNLTLTGDVVRRTLLSSLDARLERPEQRQFKANPVAMILADRAKYVAACLTIVRAYFVAGQPNTAPRLASFEGWSDTIRSPLIWLGCEDPVRTMERARDEDPNRILLRQMLAAWGDKIGTGKTTARTAASIIKFVEDANGTCDALKAAVAEVGSTRGQLNSKTLGNWLRSNKEQIADGRHFAWESNVHGARWWVEKV
jgi:putative DNA primase/helicase